jgi:hypothetical protein
LIGLIGCSSRAWQTSLAGRVPEFGSVAGDAGLVEFVRVGRRAEASEGERIEEVAFGAADALGLRDVVVRIEWTFLTGKSRLVPKGRIVASHTCFVCLEMWS